MIIAIGTDLVEIGRIERLQRRHPAFARRLLNERELQAWQRRGAQTAWLARRWAGKEAVLKALGTGLRAGLSFHDITLLNDELGAPCVHLAGGCARRAEVLGIRRWHISLSDERDHALAFVVAEGA